MRVFVTGATGFIGRELTSQLRAQNIPVFCPSRKELDLSNTEKVCEAVGSFDPSHIYHLAGISRVNDNLGMQEYFNSNTVTTMNLLKALEKTKKPVKFLFASSMHVYGNQANEVTESSNPEPLSYYAFTKFLSEELIRKSASEKTDSRFIIARLYSCFGPSQAEGFVTADLINKILALKNNTGDTLKVGPLNTFRRFVDVRDAVKILMQLIDIQHPANCETFNIASPHELKVEDILKMLLHLIDKKPKIESNADTKNAFLGLKVNTSKLFNIIKKEDFRSVETTLKDMIEFTKNNRSIPNVS